MLMVGLRIQCFKLLDITRRGCICEKCEVFLQDMAKTALIGIAGGLEEEFVVIKRREGWNICRGGGGGKKVRCLQVQNPASYDDYCGVRSSGAVTKYYHEIMVSQ